MCHGGLCGTAVKITSHTNQSVIDRFLASGDAMQFFETVFRLFYLFSYCNFYTRNGSETE